VVKAGNGAAIVTALALAWLPGCRCDAPTGGVDSAGGHSLRFDGVDDLAVIEQLLGIDGDGITLEAWIRPDGPEVPRANILARRDPAGGGDSFLFRVRADMGGVLEYGVASGSAAWGMAGKTPIPRERWTHVAVTHDRGTGTIRLYVDGALDAEGHSPVTPLTGEMPLWIGGDPLRGPGGRPFAGNLDRVRIWDHVREPAQLAETRTLVLRGDEPGLVLWLPMDEGRGGRTANAGGGDRDAVLGELDGEDPSDPEWSAIVPP
jgi:large repetitive protein